MAAYCTVDDLLIGDIPLADKYGDGTSFVNMAADEIDSQIGHIYVTPVVFDESTPEKAARVRPSKLLLKKLNYLFASGRIVLDMAAGGEDDNLHAYGKRLLDEALRLLSMVSDGRIELVDAPLIVPEEVVAQDTGPMITNEDPYSLVQGFYDRFYKDHVYPVMPVPMRPYDTPPVAEV